MNGLREQAPVLSVILPVYNACRFIQDSVCSILNQSFKDFELIIVDDGSTDGTGDILNGLALLDDRIVLVSRENRGLVASLNQALDMVRGEFIARMDADDIALPERFAEQLNFLDAQGLDLCGTSVQCFGSAEHLWHYPATPKEVEVHLLFDAPFAHPTVMCRRRVFANLRYRESFAFAEDFDLWQCAWEQGFVGGNVRKVLLLYRLHDSQISFSLKSRQEAVAEGIRYRHWMAIAGASDGAHISELLQILKNGDGDIATVRPLLALVFHKHGGAAAAPLAAQFFRIAVKAAAASSRPWNDWKALLSGCGLPRNRRQEWVLLLLWALKLGPGTGLFRAAKHFYLSRKWR